MDELNKNLGTNDRYCHLLMLVNGETEIVLLVVTMQISSCGGPKAPVFVSFPSESVVLFFQHVSLPYLPL
jgi:hypothetical protein